MFNNTITWIVCILMILLTIDCYNRFFRVKEGLETPPKETVKQKQQQKQQEILERSTLSPANINSNNLKYIKRHQQEIKKTISNLKERINSTAGKIKEQCCKINKNYLSDSCNTSTKRMIQPACKIKNPCKPCEPGTNNKDPHLCCPELITTHK